jgi:hypothetical protein
VAHELLFAHRREADDSRQILGEHVHYHLAFIQAQQTVVDEDAGQLVADNGGSRQRPRTDRRAAGLSPG